jgi:hypothetical protein
MNFWKYFCKTTENTEVPVPIVSVNNKLEASVQTESKNNEVETQTVKKTSESVITETDPGTLSITNDSATLTEDGGIVIQSQPSQELKNIFKLKPASKYTIGKQLSMGYLTPDRYYFMKSKYSDKIVLFGKCIKFDKFDNKKVIFRLSDTNELNIFDYSLFYFYRAIPKK